MTEDVVAYLSSLPEELLPTRIQEEITLLRPQLADLYQADRATFSIVAKLVKEKLGLNRKDLEASLKPLLANDSSPTQATQLLDLTDEVELFHTPDGKAWGTLSVNGHREHWELKARGFRWWVARVFFEQEHKAIGAQALQETLGVLEAKALFDGPEQRVFTRVAEHEGRIFLDLANDRWEAVEISATGWRIEPSPPVRFRRPRGMSPLPTPTSGGSLTELRSFVNVQDEDWPLLIAWLLMAFSPRGPYPILGLSGEQGSAKSTTARVLRALIDPSPAPLRSVPREERDLMISAQAGWALSFDNLSFFPAWLSDAFCRLATGGGFSTRELYTNDEEMLFDAQRPILFTAIEDIALIGDLVDRSIKLTLPPVSETNRRTEGEFWQAFETVRPRIVGALLDVVVVALRNLPTVKLAKLPRMADFALWVTAAEAGLGWDPGTFQRAYHLNRITANDMVVEASMVALALRRFLEKQNAWEGTATELKERLEHDLSPEDLKKKNWPKNAVVLSGAVRRLAPSLRARGIEVSFGKTPGKNSKRIISLRMSTDLSDATDAPDAPRDFAGDVGDAEDESATQGATHRDALSSESDAKNPHKNNSGVAGVASVAPLPTHSHDVRATNRELF